MFNPSDTTFVKHFISVSSSYGDTPREYHNFMAVLRRGRQPIRESDYASYNYNFKFGRYNNTTENPKLYRPINTSCNKIGMEGISKTGNLFPNSVTLTKKELYTELSRAKFRPFR